MRCVLLKVERQKELSAANKKVFSLYAIVMLIIYIGYVFMNHLRVSREKQFAGEETSTEAIDSINQATIWMIGFEVSFALLFLVCGVIYLYLYHKNDDFNLVRNYTVLNIGLFIVVALLGSGLSLVLSVKLSNLVQIVFIPTYLLVALVLYLIYTTRKKREEDAL